MRVGGSPAVTGRPWPILDVSAACDAIRRKHVTSGVTAKGSALGSGRPESGASAERARKLSGGRSRNGTSPTVAEPVLSAPVADDPALESEGPGPVQFSGEGAFGPAGAGSSIRTLILGIDYDGRIVQHDRSAPRILAREPDELLGAKLTDLTTAATAVPSGSGSALDSDPASEDG